MAIFLLIYVLIYVCVQDFAYHGLAAFFYLSAAVALANITFKNKLGQLKIYQIDIAAVVRTDFKTKYKQHFNYKQL